MSNIPINTIMHGKMKSELKKEIDNISEFEKSTRKFDPEARDLIKQSLSNLEDAYSKLDIKKAIDKDKNSLKLRDSFSIPTQLKEGSLDEKTVPHEKFKNYDHSLEKTRELK
jgi:hypothetical protein